MDPARLATATRRQYDRWAGVYDRLWRRYNRATAAVLQRAARLRPGEKVLNVGCGTGAFEQRVLAERPDQFMTGTDLSEKMLRVARRKTGFAPNARFVQADAHALPFADASFGVVVSASALHYFDDPVRALGEMARVMRSGGRLVLLDWCRDAWTIRLFDAVLRRLDPAHRRAYTRAELRAFLRAAGFRLTRLRTVRRWWWSLMIAEARR